MTDSIQHRCFNHPSRESAARCPECNRMFCRECVTEHEDRVICSSCLAFLSRAEERRHSRILLPWRIIQCIAAFTLLWAVFYMMGRLLLLVPSDFHDGTFLQRIGEE